MKNQLVLKNLIVPLVVMVVFVGGGLWNAPLKTSSARRNGMSLAPAAPTTKV